MSRPKLTPLERAAKAWRGRLPKTRANVRTRLKALALEIEADEAAGRKSLSRGKLSAPTATRVLECAQRDHDVLRALGLVLKLLDAAEAMSAATTRSG